MQIKDQILFLPEDQKGPLDQLALEGLLDQELAWGLYPLHRASEETHYIHKIQMERRKNPANQGLVTQEDQVDHELSSRVDPR